MYLWIYVLVLSLINVDVIIRYRNRVRQNQPNLCPTLYDDTRLQIQVFCFIRWYKMSVIFIDGKSRALSLCTEG